MSFAIGFALGCAWMGGGMVIGLKVGGFMKDADERAGYAEAEGLGGMSDSDRVHVTVDTPSLRTPASGNGIAASLRSEQVRNDD